MIAQEVEYSNGYFNPGDVVVCISTSKCRSYIRGESYTVREQDRGMLRTMKDSKGMAYNAWHIKHFRKLFRDNPAMIRR